MRRIILRHGFVRGKSTIILRFCRPPDGRRPTKPQGARKWRRTSGTMALIERDLFGQKHDKVETAIKRFKTFEPAEGYYLADSGGKDSTAVRALARMAGVRFDSHYNVTTIDPPALVRFIREKHQETIFERPELSMRELIVRKQFPPTRIQRYCCAELKEAKGAGRVVVTGVRWAESARRRKNKGIVNISGSSVFETAERLNVVGVKNNYGLMLNSDNDENRRLVECCMAKAKVMLNPIVDWTNEDVWEFIRSYNIPYCGLYDEGFKRLGCVSCPLGGCKSMKRELEFFPQFVNFYIKTFDEMLEARRRSGKVINKQWTDGESVLAWWIGATGKVDEQQIKIEFEEGSK